MRRSISIQFDIFPIVVPSEKEWEFWDKDIQPTGTDREKGKSQVLILVHGCLLLPVEFL